MQKTALPNLPDKRATDYALGLVPERYARVIYVPQMNTPQQRTIEVQAFEIDELGRFVAQLNGAPSRTPGSVKTIQMTGMGDTHTLVPGWVRQVGDFAAAPEGVPTAVEKPATANEGDQIWFNDALYRWDLGEVERITRGAADELRGLILNSLATQDLDL